MKRLIISMALCVMMTVPAAAATEGNGFNTPQEAAEAYIQGLADNDIETMLAACAVETYTENFDLGQMVTDFQSLQPNLADGFVPQKSFFSKQLDIELRRSGLVDNIRYQYLTLIDSTILEGLSISYNKENEDINDFLDSNFISDDSEILSSIRFTGTYLNVDDITDGKYSMEQNMERFRKTFARYGVDEAVCLAPVIEAGGRQYMLAVELGRYGDRWYVLMFGGQLGSILGIPNTSGGLEPFEFKLSFQN